MEIILKINFQTRLLWLLSRTSWLRYALSGIPQQNAIWRKKGMVIKMKKIGIKLRAKKGLSDEDYIKIIKELGFETVFSTVWETEEALKTADILAKNGLTYDTLHSPFKRINDIWSVGEDGDAMYNELVNSVDACVAVGAPIVVVHLSSGQNPPPTTDAGRGRYIQLVDYAAKKNIKIAFENQRMLGNIGWAFEEFKKIDSLGN